MARKDYDKKTVTCYLPSNLEKQVQAYCTENELTRKAKDEDGNETIEPRWGTGIVKILEDYFNSQVQSTVQDNVQGTVQTQVQNDVQSTVQSTVQDETGGTKSQKEPTLEERVALLEEEIKSLQQDALTRQDFNGWFPQLPLPTAQTEETTTTHNNETPASEEKSGGIEAQQRDGEATIPQEKDKIRHHSTTTAQTEENEYSELPQPIALRPPRKLEQGEYTEDLLTAKKVGENLNCDPSMISKWLKGNETTNQKYKLFAHNYERVIPYGKTKSFWRKVK